jgi:hypothetical protein
VRRQPIRLTLNDQRSQPATWQSPNTCSSWTILAGGAGVDRRFNRARYDADQTVAAFAARLKDAVDLDTVCEDLARVVQTALEPAHVSVWTTRHE